MYGIRLILENTGCPKKKFLTKNVNFKGFRRSKSKMFREQTPLKIQFCLLGVGFSKVLMIFLRYSRSKKFLSEGVNRAGRTAIKSNFMTWLTLALIQKVQTWQILINQAVNCIKIFKVMFLSWLFEQFCNKSSVYQQYWKKYTSTGKSGSNI